MKIIKKFLLLLIFIFPVADALPHGLFFVPGKTSPNEDPYRFIRYIKESYNEYTMINRRNPATWNELWPFMERKATGSTVLERSSCKLEGTVMTSDAVIKKKKVAYTYYISNGKPWKVFSANSAGEDNWIIRSDFENPYRYYAEESDEISAINKKILQLKGKKIIGFDINFKRTGILGEWQFYHKEGFNSLFIFLEDSSEYCYFKSQIVKAMKSMPDLYRFTSSISRLEGLIQKEKKLPIKDDSYRQSYIDSLYDLKKMITAN